MNLQEKIDKFAALAGPMRSEPEFQRISLYTQEKKGSRLQVYLQSAAPETEKGEFLDELIQIIETKDWAKLPGAPNGQAESAAPAAAAPAAAPAPAKPAAGAAPAPTTDDDDIEEDNPTPDGEQDPLIAALQKRLAKGAGLSEKQVRKIIKEEVPKIVRAELRAYLKGLLDATKEPS